MSIYDVLGKSTSSTPALINVPHRSGQSLSARRHGDYTLWTACIDGACVDGLREAASLEPLIDARLDAGEREAFVSEDPNSLGGWLERGVDIMNVAPATISVRRATAWFNGSAARSSASIECATYARGGRWRMSLADAVGTDAAGRLLVDARQFLRDSRESSDRASGLGDISPISFALDASGTVVLCVESAVGASDGFAERIRATPR